MGDTAARNTSFTACNNMVGSLVEHRPVVIFSRSNCFISHSVKSLIRSFGANPTVYELDELRNGSEIDRALIQMGCQQSVPAVFIGQKYVGGSSELLTLHIQQRLSTLLIEAGAIWI